MTVVELCTPLLEQLIAEDFRSGFEDTVLQRCRRLIENEGMSAEAREFWNAGCCFSHDFQPEHKKSVWLELYGEEFTELFLEATRVESLPGCFVMPEWGTRGT